MAQVFVAMGVREEVSVGGEREGEDEEIVVVRVSRVEMRALQGISVLKEDGYGQDCRRRSDGLWLRWLEIGGSSEESRGGKFGRGFGDGWPSRERGEDEKKEKR